MKKNTTYENVIKAAGHHWVTANFDQVIDSDFLSGQVQVIRDAFEAEGVEVREDILDAAGIYRNIRWDGEGVPIIESECSPWVEDENGVSFDFGGETAGFRILTSGVLVCGTEVQMDDNAGMSDHFTDLHAARLAAAEVTRITGREHAAWFHGTY